MGKNKLSFVPKYKIPIQNREKTSTLRFNLNTIPNTGDILQAITTEGEPIGKIKITEIESLKVKEVPERDLDGHKNYSSTQEVISHLNEFYHDTITPDSTLTLIHFRLIE